MDEARVVYVIDTSTSMGSQQQAFVDENGNQVQGCRLDRAKAELAISISNLSDEFEFDVVGFTCTWQAHWGSTERATQANKGAATAWIIGPAGYGRYRNGSLRRQGPQELRLPDLRPRH